MRARRKRKTETANTGMDITLRVSRARKRGYEREMITAGGGGRQSFKVLGDISACAHSYILEL